MKGTWDLCELTRRGDDLAVSLSEGGGAGGEVFAMLGAWEGEEGCVDRAKSG